MKPRACRCALRSVDPLGWVRGRAAAAGLAAMLLAACGTPPVTVATPQVDGPQVPAVVQPVVADVNGQVLGRNDRLLIYRPASGDQLGSIAARFLGSADLAWMLAEANGVTMVEAGSPLIIPLRPLNPLGVTADRVQTVPILCYHRFGTGNSKMIISPARFASQLEWLSRNGYHVVRLADVQGFLSGQQPLPPKSVVITIDDGYESVHRHAFPLLRQYGFPATLFVYSDFIGAGDALRWPQLQEMASSGLVDIQSHSKSHRNLIERLPVETEDRYRANLDAEMTVPRDVLQRRLTGVKIRHMAYPFGDANATVVDSAARNGYELAATVVPGGNAFNAQPLLLRRTMIFGDLDLDGFKSRLQTYRNLATP
ncbi:polysaccharide deacetylase family protein [Ideonella sp. A 288]|uniref:polysaccharide deacetylase family protein n=1 Tax=Ideonella sp. A 288 TaxID=1962181 RepID=UPI000B4BE369|nr:polysaccharide deacetylase family protein [Ideonella sp. A 288]